ncbi:bifunctional folylpolyglutamate synthase/dihydrofolate synthase [uncultured Pseudodesulfovibrio sp.]|uniref:bifunctional folylpolyglutamate synthase/dihydrofolate synthase n=1 Tax=uncultured Pseudodesulfovibrio sp. TaxID=2035858 RepID=UPI0037481421
MGVTQFNDYDQLAEYMDRLGLFHMDLTLSRMEAFWKARGLPDIPVVHVVGTNGKGSTSTFFGSIARAHGLKTGLFTSPHFLSPRERVQVNRTVLPRALWVELANEILSTPGGDELTYFEFQTCLAMLAFERQEVDVAIMEAGLGGKFDATNVFKPCLTLFTPIGMDHEKILGPTLKDIARDKAGAIHGGSHVITGVQVTEALIPLQDRAKAVGARFMYAVDMADPVEDDLLGLPGIHQSANARLALAGWRYYAVEKDIRSEHVAELFGLETAFLPGRMQWIELGGKAFILDGAHNSHALEALSAALHAEDIRPGAVVFACLKDKDCTAMLPLVQGLTDGPILVPSMENERASDAETLAGLLGETARSAESMEQALEACEDVEGPILVCGSLYLLSEFYLLHPEFLSPN